MIEILVGLAVMIAFGIIADRVRSWRTSWRASRLACDAALRTGHIGRRGEW